MRGRQPARDPVGEGWIKPSAPVEHLGRFEAWCIADRRETLHDEYAVVLGPYRGLGSLAGRLRNPSRSDPVGPRSLWAVCSECGGMIPRDELAKRQATELGARGGLFHSG